MAAPGWQVRISGTWMVLDQAISGLLEGAFISRSTLTLPITGFLSSSMPQLFNVHTMDVSGLPVRRTAKDAVSTTVYYWGDDDWYEIVEPHAKCLLHTAISVGRERTALYVGDTTYDIFLESGKEKQINRVTGNVRPLLVKGDAATSVLGLTVDEKEMDIEDDPAMPVEFRCPITQMVMRMPVVASDGHSYEFKALQKWMLKKQTSPVTGQPLSGTCFVVNHNLKKLIRDWDQKKEQELNLFGDDSDDDAETDKSPDETGIGDASSSLSAQSFKRMKKPTKGAGKAKVARF